MSRSAAQGYTPPPRMWDARMVAARLKRSKTWLAAHLRELAAMGFPPRNGVLGLWDSVAIEKWLDRQAGLAPESTLASEEAAMLAKIDNRIIANASH